MKTTDSRILTDPEDRHWLERYTFSVQQHGSEDSPIFYACVRPTIDGRRSPLYLHRLILGAKKGERVDHINGNGLDNRRENLRFATASGNGANSRTYRNNTSGYKGVHWEHRRGKWYANLTHQGKTIFIGRFDLPEDAARAYDAKAVEIHGEFARTNHMLGLYPWQKEEAAD